MRRRFLHGRFVIGVIAVALITPVMVPSPASSAVVAGGANDVIVDLLPPGARQLVAAVTIVKSLSARNRVYREARDVQRDLRAYYDARIDKAKEMAANRTQLGLRKSQIAAYMRVATTLRAERDAALQLAEDEKRAAKYTFEGRFRTELFGALLRTPRGQDALRRVQDMLGDVKSNFKKIQAAIEGQNPIAGLVEDLKKQVDKVRIAGEVLSVISGKAGAALVEQANSVQRVIGNITSATDQAAAASSEAIGTIDAAIGALDGHINVQRTPRAAADILIGQAMEHVTERILTPGGETPTEDVVADIIAAGANPALVNSTAVAVGAIDPSELATMRERIRAQLLKDKLDTIAQQCGRLTGALHNDTVAALDDGSNAPTSTPCTLFRNPETLADFIRRMREKGNPKDTNTTVATTTPADDDTIEGIYTGEVALGFTIPNYAIIDSLVEFTISSGGGLEVTMALTTRYGARYVDDTVVCQATVRQLFEGSGSAGSTGVEADLSLVGFEVLAAEGTGCGIDEDWEMTLEQDLADEFSNDPAGPLTGVVEDGVITATIEDGFLMVSASRK